VIEMKLRALLIAMNHLVVDRSGSCAAREEQPVRSRKILIQSSTSLPDHGSCWYQAKPELDFLHSRPGEACRLIAKRIRPERTAVEAGGQIKENRRGCRCPGSSFWLKNHRVVPSLQTVFKCEFDMNSLSMLG